MYQNFKLVKMKKIIFSILVVCMSGVSAYSQYKGGPYDGYYTLLDTAFQIPNGIENNLTIVKDFALQQNYPNPFNPSTIIKFSINNDAEDNIAEMSVYDVNGKLAMTLFRRKLSEGDYQIKFDGSGLPAGVYFYKLKLNDYSETKKMILLK